MACRHRAREARADHSHRGCRGAEPGAQGSFGCARNIAEGAARTSRADKARVYGIARGECGECVASIELAGAKGQCGSADVTAVVELGGRLSAMLYRLTR